jgi:hypothetical protein
MKYIINNPNFGEIKLEEIGQPEVLDRHLREKCANILSWSFNFIDKIFEIELVELSEDEEVVLSFYGELIAQGDEE